MIYAIADLHLSFKNPKPMDIFGENWTDHAKKIKENWKNKIKREDTVILPGDFSWAMALDDTYEDFEFLDSLPRKKNNAKRKSRLLVEQFNKTKRVLKRK